MSPASKPVLSARKAQSPQGWIGGSLRSRPTVTVLLLIGCLALIGTVGYLVAVQVYGGQRWRQARQAVERDDLRAGREHLEACLEIWPTSAEVHFQLARLCRRAGDFDAARDHLKKADDLDWVRDLVDLEYLLSRAQSGAIRAVEETLLTRLRQGHAEERLILEALVKGYLQVNLLSDAFHWATVWLERHPDDWQPYYLRGLSLERAWMLNVAANASEDYKRALDRKPELTDARLRLGEILVRENRYHDALTHLEIYRRHDPDDPAVVAATARCLRALGRGDEARELLDAWLPSHAGHGTVCLIRGQLELDRDELDPACEWLFRPETLALSSIEAHQILGQVYRRLGRQAEAQEREELGRRLDEDVRRLHELTTQSLTNPKDLFVRIEAGTILLRQGQDQDAARWLLSALQEDPNHKPTHQALAELYAKMGDHRRARDHRRKALE